MCTMWTVLAEGSSFDAIKNAANWICQPHWFLIVSVAAMVACLLCFCGTIADAQEWARKMFKTTSHDFGAVARGDIKDSIRSELQRAAVVAAAAPFQ